MVSRTCCRPHTQRTMRSMPMPKPECGTLPEQRKAKAAQKVIRATRRAPVLLPASGEPGMIPCVRKKPVLVLVPAPAVVTLYFRPPKKELRRVPVLMVNGVIGVLASDIRRMTDNNVLAAEMKNISVFLMLLEIIGVGNRSKPAQAMMPAAAVPAPGGRCALTHAEQMCRSRRAEGTASVPLMTTAPAVAYG